MWKVTIRINNIPVFPSCEISMEPDTYKYYVPPGLIVMSGNLANRGTSDGR